MKTKIQQTVTNQFRVLWKEGDFRTHQREKFVKNDQNAWKRYFLSP